MMADVIPQHRMVRIVPQDRDLGFDGTDVEKFLDLYERAARINGASEYDMARQLRLFICSDEVFDMMETFEGFKNHRWPDLKASMLAYWGQADPPFRLNFSCGSWQPFKPPTDPARMVSNSVEDEQPSHAEGALAKQISLPSPLAFPSLAEDFRSDAAQRQPDKLESSGLPSVFFPPGLSPFELACTTPHSEEEDMSADPEPVERSTEEPSRAFSQPPQPSNGSCGSRQQFNPPAVVASEPLARAEHEERCMGYNSEPFDPSNKGLSHTDPAGESLEDCKSFEPLAVESFPGPRVVEDLTPTACYQSSDLLCQSDRPNMLEPSHWELPSGHTAPLIKAQHAQMMLNQDLVQEAFPNHIFLPDQNSRSQESLLRIQDTTKPSTPLNLISPSGPFNPYRGSLFQIDSRFLLVSFTLVVKVDFFLARSRTGVGPDPLWTSEDHLRNEGKLLLLQLERVQGGLSLAEAERPKVSPFLGMRLRVDTRYVVKTLRSATLVSHTPSPLAFFSSASIIPTAINQFSGIRFTLIHLEKDQEWFRELRLKRKSSALQFSRSYSVDCSRATRCAFFSFQSSRFHLQIEKQSKNYMRVKPELAQPSTGDLSCPQPPTSEPNSTEPLSQKNSLPSFLEVCVADAHITDLDSGLQMASLAGFIVQEVLVSDSLANVPVFHPHTPTLLLTFSQKAIGLKQPTNMVLISQPRELAERLVQLEDPLSFDGAELLPTPEGHLHKRNKLSVFYLEKVLITALFQDPRSIGIKTFQELLRNEGKLLVFRSEFGGALAEMLRSLPGQHRVSTPYYPEAQGMVERGHAPLKAALVKLAGESGKNCRKFLPLVLFADRISTKRTTGYSPYELVFGQRAALPIDLDIESFLGVDWDEVRGTSDLLVARSRQLERSEESRRVAHDRMMKSRADSIRYWQDRNSDRLRDSLSPGTLVLAYNRSLEVQWGQLFAHKWNGPYRIVKQVHGGSYVLAELDGAELKRRFAADQVKEYFPRGGIGDQK